MQYRLKYISIIIVLLLILNFLIINNFEEVTAARADMNLEGDIFLNNTYMLANSTWRNDTDFCVWVYHDTHWTRYPAEGWRSTHMGRYFYMLPSADNGTHWHTGDKYRVQVNAEPFWNATNTNYSSHGSGDPGEYTPEGSIDNYIIWKDPDNWQRWDVQVPGVDLLPTNIRVDDTNYNNTPAYLNIDGGLEVTITANVTNIGTSENPQPFNFTIYESTRDGLMLTPEFLLEVGILTKLSPYGGDSGEYSIKWTAPTTPGIYFVAIYVDHYNLIPESNKVNNLFLIGFIVGGVPDLELTYIIADGISYDSSPSDLIYIGKSQKLTISTNVTNIGTESTQVNFNLTFILAYEPSIFPSEILLAKNFAALEPQMDIGKQIVVWTSPDLNIRCKITLQVDPDNRVQEIREDNNDFIFNFEVRDLPDLALDTMTQLTQIVPVGSENHIEVNVSNIGNVKTSSSVLGFYNGSGLDSYDPTMDLSSIIKSYDIPQLDPGKTLPSGFRAVWLAPMRTGTYNVSVKLDIFDEVPELKETNNILRFKFTVEDYPEPPIPTINIVNNDINLNWISSPTANRAYYLIYRAEHQMGFDLSTPDYNTSRNLLPLANEWVDTGAVGHGQERYYCIRTVNTYGWIGYTSLTVGKYTQTFKEGYDTFSLPLEPFNSVSVHEFINGLSKPSGNSVSEPSDLITAYEFDTRTQQWLGHPKFLPQNIDNFALEMGKGYMLYSPEPVQYTFSGYPGSMIRYIDILPTNNQFREGLTLDLENNGIELTWEVVDHATEYKIFQASNRTGFDYSAPIDITVNNFINFDLPEEFEVYYSIIPVDHFGRFGSSTYSIGVRGQVLGVGYNTFSLGLKPENLLLAHTFLIDFFEYDIETVYRYDVATQSWRGHPRFLPAEVDDFELAHDDANIAYVYLDEVRFFIVGR